MSDDRNEPAVAPAGGGPGRRTPVLWWLAASVLLAAPFGSHLHKSLRSNQGDWLAVYNMAEYSLRTGELVAERSESIVRNQLYPPLARPLLMLLALPPKWASAVLSFLLFAALYLTSARHIASCLLPDGPAAPTRAALKLLLCMAPYVWADLAVGNLTSVLLASVTGGFVLARRGRPILAGVALSVGILLKIIPLLCLLPFVVRRQWKVPAGALLGLLAVGLLPTLVLFGPARTWESHARWYRVEFSRYTPLRMIGEPTGYSVRNQSVACLLGRLFVAPEAGAETPPVRIAVAELPRPAVQAAYAVLMGAAALALVAFVWRLRRSSSDRVEAGAYALCVGAMIWFSPWLMTYYFSLAIWPFAAVVGYLASADRERSSPRLPFAALVVWFAVMPALASPRLLACSVTLAAVAMLLATLAALIGREARRAPEAA